MLKEEKNKNKNIVKRSEKEIEKIQEILVRLLEKEKTSTQLKIVFLTIMTIIEGFEEEKYKKKIIEMLVKNYE